MTDPSKQRVVIDFKENGDFFIYSDPEVEVICRSGHAPEDELYRYGSHPIPEEWLRGKRFGFSLEEIRQLLELYEPGGTNKAQIAATISVGRQRLGDMERQYAELSEAIVELKTQLSDAETRLAAASNDTTTG